MSLLPSVLTRLNGYHYSSLMVVLSMSSKCPTKCPMPSASVIKPATKYLASGLSQAGRTFLSVLRPEPCSRFRQDCFLLFMIKYLGQCFTSKINWPVYDMFSFRTICPTMAKRETVVFRFCFLDFKPGTESPFSSLLEVV